MKTMEGGPSKCWLIGAFTDSGDSKEKRSWQGKDLPPKQTGKPTTNQWIYDPNATGLVLCGLMQIVLRTAG